MGKGNGLIDCIDGLKPHCWGYSTFLFVGWVETTSHLIYLCQMNRLKILFGLDLDDRHFPETRREEHLQVLVMGTSKLLGFLEKTLGLPHPNRNEVLRVEQFRQLLKAFKAKHKDVFFAQSFDADNFATATLIMRMRDDLLLGGWDFQMKNDMPPRLRVFAELEAFKRSSELYLYEGFAERLFLVSKAAKEGFPNHFEIELMEPLDLLPPYLSSLFDTLRACGITIAEISSITSEIHTGTDLSNFKKYFLSTAGDGDLTNGFEYKNDKSLLFLKADSDVEAASWMSSLFKTNPEWVPLLFIPDKSRLLDQALSLQGLPALGITSSSHSRPILQLLKLIPAFLWHPIDPNKVLEFVTLPIKPLDNKLSYIISNAIANIPGVKSDRWLGAVNDYFRSVEADALGNPEKEGKSDEIRANYEFWFERKRYEQGKQVPKEDVTQLYQRLYDWACQLLEADDCPGTMKTLQGQSASLLRLLHALPENDRFISDLELERMIRTVYESSTYTFREEEVGHLPYFVKHGALIEPVDELVWWNFSLEPQGASFSLWYPKESEFLMNNGVQLDNPQQQIKRKNFLGKNPVMRSKERLVMVIFDTYNAQELTSHQMMADFYACFGEKTIVSSILNLNEAGGREALGKLLKIPSVGAVKTASSKEKRPFVDLADDNIEMRETESYTSLDKIFYYPHQWVFQHKLELRPSPVLSLVGLNTMMGNIAHGLVNAMFKKGYHIKEKEELLAWIEQHMEYLLEREGAVLLRYGMEPEKIAFVQKIKRNVWTLLWSIRENGWEIAESEKHLTGEFFDIKIHGFADLLLKKANGELAVLDLKWGSLSYYKEMLKGRNDLQLTFYAKMATENDGWAHTAYFSLRDGKLVARNNLAFADAEATNPKDDHIAIYEDIWSKMEKTYEWRRSQLKNGVVELRSEHTAPLLEDIYNGMYDLPSISSRLEMKRDSSKFDDYKVLLGLLDD